MKCSAKTRLFPAYLFLDAEPLKPQKSLAFAQLRLQKYTGNLASYDSMCTDDYKRYILTLYVNLVEKVESNMMIHATQ